MQYSIKTWYLTIIVLFVVTYYLTLLFYIIPNKHSHEMYAQLASEIVSENELLLLPEIYHNYSHGKWRFLSAEQENNLSKLGRILFLDEKPPKLSQSQKNYNILIWKSRKNSKQSDHFKNCPVKNCRIKHGRKSFSLYDMVIFNLGTIKKLRVLNNMRKPDQIWAFVAYQSPLNIFPSSQKVNLSIHNGTFPPSQKINLSIHNGMFNWSMTYRMDSDIPIPYGRTVMLQIGEKGIIQTYSEWNKHKKEDVLMAIVSSHCEGTNHRWKYVKQLQKYLKIDIYGKCGNNTCHSDLSPTTTKLTKDCSELSKYKFYLAFENSNCDEYITEKLWWYGYAKNTIPIVMGGSKFSYEQLLPPHSFLNTEDFARPSDLADYVIYLNRTPSHIEKYFTWKRYFKILNEHGHFGTKSIRYCRICEALNYNNKTQKIYEDLNVFWNLDKCHLSGDAVG